MIIVPKHERSHRTLIIFPNLSVWQSIVPAKQGVM